jgi:uncharacterized protein
MKFEWDKQKAKSNLSKHGISFEEAQTIFDDPLYVDFYDPDHSKDEDPYIINRRIIKQSCFVSLLYGKRR